MVREEAVRPANYRWLREAQPADFVYAVVAFLSIVCFVLLTVLVLQGRTATLDHDLILDLRSFAFPLLTGAMLAVTFTTGNLAIPAAAVFAYLLYRRDGWRTAWYYVAACLTAQLLNLVLKYEIHRARPHGISPKLTRAGGPSYPSADAMMAVLVFGLGTLMLSRSIESPVLRAAARGLALAFIVAAALARVYLGAHWPSDVLAGVLAGVACSAAWVVKALSAPASSPVGANSPFPASTDVSKN